jgi:hypothetical protein
MQHWITKKNCSRISKESSKEEEQNKKRWSLRIRGQKRAREHRGKGLEDDERESGTICNANISISR